MARGPSPRVRGSRRLRVSAEAATRVHPRVCGEAIALEPIPLPDQGPSPRVRGSRRLRARHDPRVGSIPACAGKPSHQTSRRSSPEVHPRVCGEAQRGHPGSISSSGPSPRVRGSLSCWRRNKALVGSIPACAGKPTNFERVAPKSRVHPRVCGEAVSVNPRASEAVGPSPRVRGSPFFTMSRASASRSIPACAGKPTRDLQDALVRAVHPRVCGEAQRLVQPGFPA